MMGSLIHTGTPLGNIDTSKPRIANGNRQYPIALIDWNNDLSILYCTLCCPAVCSLCWWGMHPAKTLWIYLWSHHFCTVSHPRIVQATVRRICRLEVVPTDPNFLDHLYYSIGVWARGVLHIWFYVLSQLIISSIS